MRGRCATSARCTCSWRDQPTASLHPTGPITPDLLLLCASARDSLVPRSRRPPYRPGFVLHILPMILTYSRSLPPLAPRHSCAPRRHRFILPLPTARAAYKRPPSSRPTGLAPHNLASTPHFKVNYFLKRFLYSSPPPSDEVDRIVRL